MIAVILYSAHHSELLNSRNYTHILSLKFVRKHSKFSINSCYRGHEIAPTSCSGVWIVAPLGPPSRAARVTTDGIPQNGMLILVTTAYCPLTASLALCKKVTNRGRRSFVTGSPCGLASGMEDLPNRENVPVTFRGLCYEVTKGHADQKPFGQKYSVMRNMQI